MVPVEHKQRVVQIWSTDHCDVLTGEPYDSNTSITSTSFPKLSLNMDSQKSPPNHILKLPKPGQSLQKQSDGSSFIEEIDYDMCVQ